MIEIDRVSKKYKVYAQRSDRFREWLWRGRRSYHTPIWALRDISLQIPKGEAFGIIGMNGAGKSTLLKIITGTTVATEGAVQLQGRVAALLELGTGFMDELSGRDNVLMNGRLLGLSEDEITERLPGIAAFSELGEYFDKPVRTYSTGMYVRLAFSLASSVDPEILIIDEALSVGDAYFQQKCLKRIEAFKKRGVTILFVSHDLGAVKLLCDRVALLSEGQLLECGEPRQMLELYNALIARRDGTGQQYEVRRGDEDGFGDATLRSGNRRAEILSVVLQGDDGAPIDALEAGSSALVRVKIRFNEAMENPTVGILIRDRMGYDIFGTNTADLFYETGGFSAGESAHFDFACKMNLGPGEYTITVAAHSQRTHVDDCYEWVDRILTFKVLPRSDFRFLGVSYLQPVVTLERHLDH